MDTTRAQQQALDDELEPTLQVALDALKFTPFYNAFKISTDVPEICMQEFWVTVSRHHSSLCFKLNGTPFYKAFQITADICPKLPNQQFEELPFEEAILTFLRDLGHGGEIKVITDVNVNKLHQPWRSFVAVINKCLSGKKGERYQNSESYKEYYAIASGAEPPKTKASVKKKQTSAKALKPAKKEQPIKTSKDKGLTVLYEVALTEAEQMKLDTKRSLIETHSSRASGSGVDEGTDAKIQDDDDEQTDSDNDGDDYVHPKFSTHDMNEEETNEEAEVDALYRDVNVNLEGRDTEMTDAPRTN
ncbi:hypothetical protein Tco_1515652 [Tanacetum coccineum]